RRQGQSALRANSRRSRKSRHHRLSARLRHEGHRQARPRARADGGSGALNDESAPRRGRGLLLALGGAVLFIGLATLFVELLRPLAPSQAAAMNADAPRRALPPEAKLKAKDAAAAGALRPPIATVP